MSKSVLILLLLLVVPVKAKDWRGIKPVYSTREDVERLLGPQPLAEQTQAITS
jgi:hypothetical protein